MQEHFSKDRRGVEENGSEKARPVKRDLEQRTQLHISDLTLTVLKTTLLHCRPNLLHCEDGSRGGSWARVPGTELGQGATAWWSGDGLFFSLSGEGKLSAF